jgi:hypothetical protein
VSKFSPAIILTLAGCLTLLIAADKPQPDPESIDLSAIVQMMGSSGSAAAPEDDAPYPDFKEVTKDMKPIAENTMFVLWRYPAGTPDKDTEKLLCQIPSQMLGEQFMLSISVAGGGFLTGFPLEERVVRWEVLDRELLLVEPQTGYIINPGDEVADVVRRTHPDGIRTAVPIVTKAPNGDPVIDLGPLLKSDFANLGWMSMLTGGGTGGVNPQLSQWTKTKAFALNVEIGVALAMPQRFPPGSYGKTLVHYSFWKLPETDYQPRIADDRIGYFLTANQDWSKPVTDRDLFNRYIDRWHLVKRDPSLPLCEPRQPIIYYIEKTVPVQYRHAVRDGILEWNKAFEKIGFLNAIEVRQQTDDNEWADLDPEDMRYSFFRWIVNGAGFAMGPHRANPFTGQIYDADIIFDDAMVRYFQSEADQYLPEAIVAEKLRDPAMSRFVERFPQFERQTPKWQQVVTSRHASELEMLQAVEQHMCECGRPLCSYMNGMRHQMGMARTLLAGQPQEVRERFLYDVIKEVVTHEVGHTLGLRHNFKASSIYTLDEIKARRGTGEPTCGSVMDYNPVLLMAKNATEGHFVTPTIGPWDYWVIEYGYRPFDGQYQGKQAAAESDESEAADEAPAVPAVPPAAAAIELSDIPPEVLEQMPPRVREMIASGKLKDLMASAGGRPPVPGAPAAPRIAAPPSGEAAMLHAIASRATEPQLAYATDEDTSMLSADPHTNRFDMGACPMAWAKERIKLVDQRMANILEWAVKDQESWYHLRSAFLTLMFEKIRVLDYVSRYIGGQDFNRAHRGDPDAKPPFELIDADLQRKAMQFVADEVFQDGFFKVDQEILEHLAPSRWSHQGARTSYVLDFPLHSYIGLFQWWTLSNHLFPPTLSRVYDNELRTSDPDRLTLAEYIQKLQRACWADAIDARSAAAGGWSDTNPFLTSIQRSLQREYLGLVEPIVRDRPGESVPPDIHAMLRYALQELSQQLGKTVQRGDLDFASRAHLDACKSRIDRMLSAELKEYEPMMFSGGMLLRDAGPDVPDPGQ